MTHPISAAYLERKIRSLAGLRGSAALTDLEALRGFVVLENDRPEWAKAGGEILAAAQTFVAAVAGQSTAVQLRNPVGSGVLVIVESVVLSAGLTGQLEAWLAFSVADLATDLNGNKVNRDLRQLQVIGDALAASFSGVTSAGPGVGGRRLAQHTVLGSTPVEMLRGPVILDPGKALFADETTLNATFTASLVWRERPLEGAFELR